MKKMVIALVGNPGSGKDTFADYVGNRLWETLRIKIAKFAFADKPKEIVSNVYQVPIEYFYNRVWKNMPHENLGGKTPRQAIQLIATEGFRNLIDKNTWSKYLVAQLLESRAEVNIVTDLRFPEEYAALMALSPDITVHIVGIIRETEEKYNHESEHYVEELLSKLPYSIINSGNIHEFEVAIDHWLFQKGKSIL